MIKKLLYPFLLLAVIIIQSLIIFPQAGFAATDPGLELEWKLDEGSGTTVIDSSMYGNNGTLFNGAAYTSGIEGTAVTLNGINQYVEVNNPFSFLGTVNQPYALSAWVKVPNAGESGNIVHISSVADGTGWCIPFLTLQNGAFSATGWDSSSGGVFATDSTQVVPNQWYQVVTTWDATNGLRLFVNGTLVQSTSQPDYAASGAPMYFSVGLSGGGACYHDQGYLNGTVDDPRLYDRVLTQADIGDIYGFGVPPLASTNGTSNATSATQNTSPGIPDTGYGIPANNDPAVIALSSVVAVSTVSGLLLLYKLKRIY